MSAEVVAAVCRLEWAVHLDDVMLRRTGWHYYQPDRSQLALCAAQWMADLLGWDAPGQAAELARYEQVE